MCKPKRAKWEPVGLSTTHERAEEELATLEVSLSIIGWYWSCETMRRYDSDFSTSQEAAKQAAQEWFDNLWASESEI